MVVLDPLEVVIENYPDDVVEYLEAENNPEDENAGKRLIPFSKRLYIEKEDYVETPPKGWHRFTKGAEVRLKHAYYVVCQDVVKDEKGNVVRLICSYDPNSKGGWTNDGRKVKGTSHWVSVAQAVKVEARLYEHLFDRVDPMAVEEGSDYTSNLNVNSLKVLSECWSEPFLYDPCVDLKFQFLRQGYFCLDRDSTSDKLVFNRIAGLKDSYKVK